MHTIISWILGGGVRDGDSGRAVKASICPQKVTSHKHVTDNRIQYALCPLILSSVTDVYTIKDTDREEFLLYIVHYKWRIPCVRSSF